MKTMAFSLFKPSKIKATVYLRRPIPKSSNLKAKTPSQLISSTKILSGLSARLGLLPMGNGCTGQVKLWHSAFDLRTCTPDSASWLLKRKNNHIGSRFDHILIYQGAEANWSVITLRSVNLTG
jgi:hypothetical protein